LHHARASCMLAAECLRGGKALYTPLTTPGAALVWPAPAPVPRIVWRTTHLAPKQVPNLLSGYTEGFAVMPPWNDTHCEAFLHEHFGRRVAASFRRFKHGAHKADLWRYAVLYIYGGVYLDIKVVARHPLAEIFNSSTAHDRYTWYSVLANKGDHIFNGILATPPRNPILLRAVEHAARSHSLTNCGDFHLLVRWLLHECTQVYGPIRERLHGRPPHAALAVEAGGSQLYLMREHCDTSHECQLLGRVGGTRRDRRGTCCNAYGGFRQVHHGPHDGGPLFQIRDPRYHGSTGWGTWVT